MAAVRAELRQRYAALERYEDEGTVTSLSGEALATFSTSFVRTTRSIRLVMDRTDSSDRFVLELSRAAMVTLEPSWIRPPTVPLAFAALTGATFGVFHDVPKLLMPDLVSGEPFWWSDAHGVEDPNCDEMGRVRIRSTSTPHAELYVARPSTLISESILLACSASVLQEIAARRGGQEAASLAQLDPSAEIPGYRVVYRVLAATTE
jgi:hypothetical protein